MILLIYIWYTLALKIGGNVRPSMYSEANIEQHCLRELPTLLTQMQWQWPVGMTTTSNVWITTEFLNPRRKEVTERWPSVTEKPSCLSACILQDIPVFYQCGDGTTLIVKKDIRIVPHVFGLVSAKRNVSILRLNTKLDPAHWKFSPGGRAIQHDESGDHYFSKLTRSQSSQNRCHVFRVSLERIQFRSSHPLLVSPKQLVDWAQVPKSHQKYKCPTTTTLQRHTGDARCLPAIQSRFGRFNLYNALLVPTLVLQNQCQL